MYVVFVTGGLASGKKTVCNLLHSWGATYLDTDAIAKEEQENPFVLRQLCDAFGEDIVCVDDSGSQNVNRRLLASRAFATAKEAQKLNDICWPVVKERLADLLVGGSCQLKKGSDFVVVEIPLLAESIAVSGADMRELANEIVCVSAAEDLRRKRAIARGMLADDCDNRMALQTTDVRRELISDTIFDNNGSLEALRQQVRSWYDDRKAQLF